MKLLICAATLAHLWYPPECCRDQQDCRPVPCDQIARVGTDYIYNGMKFAGDKVRLSQDTGCHACYNEWKAPFCIFLTPFS